MKILMLKAYYEPEVAASLYLTENLIDGLVKAGHEVIVYTPLPTRGVSDEVRNSYKKKKLETRFDGKLKIYRYWLPKETQSVVSRAARYAFGSLAHFVKALFCKADVLFLGSTPPINGAMGALLKKMKKISFVYCLQDIFPDSMVSANMIKEGSVLWKIGRMIENFAYQNADKIIAISEDIKKNIMKKGVSQDKIEVIYNWVDETEIVPVKREDNPLFDEFGLDRERFYVVYAGNLGNAQNIEVILQSAAKTADISDIEYIIFGKGAQEGFYKDLASDMELSNVSFFPLQPYERVSQVYSLGDVSVVSCKSGFGGSAMPSKTWSILSAGTAVLASFDAGTDLERIIETNNFGLFTKAEDAEAFSHAVLALYHDKERCDRMGENGRAFILENLTRQTAVDKYNDLFHSVKR